MWEQKRSRLVLGFIRWTSTASDSSTFQRIFLWRTAVHGVARLLKISPSNTEARNRFYSRPRSCCTNCRLTLLIWFVLLHATSQDSVIGRMSKNSPPNSNSRLLQTDRQACLLNFLSLCFSLFHSNNFKMIRR